MKIKTLAIALALTAAPALAYAEGCNKQKQAMSCAAGTVYDSASNSCLPVNT